MIHYGDKYGEQERTRFARERMRTGNCEITRGVRIDRGEERVSGVASRFGKARSRAGTLNRCTSGQALRHDCLFLLPSRHPGVVQARISFFETVASSKMQVVSYKNKSQ